jgi:hypothetical protein
MVAGRSAADAPGCSVRQIPSEQELSQGMKFGFRVGSCTGPEHQWNTWRGFNLLSARGAGVLSMCV